MRQVQLFVSPSSSWSRSSASPRGHCAWSSWWRARKGSSMRKDARCSRKLHAAAKGRLQAAHFGTYDYTASLDIAAAARAPAPPRLRLREDADEARLRRHGSVLERRRDHAHADRSVQGRAPTHDAQREENRRVVHAAWRVSAGDIRHSLSGGFYQGWDLHPAQLVARFGTVFAFFLESLGPDRAPVELRQGARPGHALGRHVRRRGDGAGLAQLLPPRPLVWRPHRGRSGRDGLGTGGLESRSFAQIARNRRKG